MSIEIQNIVSSYVSDNSIYVMAYDPYIWSPNIKVPPVTARYYIISKTKLTSQQCLDAIELYLKKKNE